MKYSDFFDVMDFKSHILSLKYLLENDIPFSFNRISDGELFILKGMNINLNLEGAVIDGKKVNSQPFSNWDHKIYNADKDTYIYEGLKGLFNYSSSNNLSLLGLPCPCCCPIKDILPLRMKTHSVQTWANLLLNSNYPFFIESILPVLQEKNIYVAVNENADLDLFSSTPHLKYFKIPNKAFPMAKQIVEDFILNVSSLKESYVILVGASTVAKIMIDKARRIFPHHSYIDIGTTLNPLLKLGLGRDYLRSYWGATYFKNGYASRKCIW